MNQKAKPNCCAGGALMLNPNLTTFLAVADCGSFNRASERLYISRPR